MTANSDLEINLNYRRKDFEKIYFANGLGKKFFHPKVRASFITTAFLMSLFVAALINWFLGAVANEVVLLAGILFGVAILNFSGNYYSAWKYRKEINEYLSELDQKKTFRLILTPETLTLIVDDEWTVERWELMTRMYCSDDHINLNSSTNYLIPRNSMTSEEFDALKSYIAERLRNYHAEKSALQKNKSLNS